MAIWSPCYSIQYMWQMITVVQEHLSRITEPSITRPGDRLGSTLPSQGPVQVHKKPPVVLFMAEAQWELIYVRDMGHRKWHIVGSAGGGMPELEHQRYRSMVGVRRFTGAHGYWYGYIQAIVTNSHTHTHTSNTVGQVGQSLTHILVLVPCNPERKHCSAHSLAGWPNGSRQRAGH